MAATVATLAFFPALLLASSTPLESNPRFRLAEVITISLLLFLIDESRSAPEQASALVAFALIALMLPATHLAGFADLAVQSRFCRAVVL